MTSRSKRWISPKEAAELTGFHYRTILNYIKAGIIEAHQAKKNTAWYVDVFSIPTYMRENPNGKK